MDELLEKKLRSLKLKLAIAEKELQASSGKWKLGALLGAGHASAMNREVVKLRERLEGKIEKLKSEIESIVGKTPATGKQADVAKEPQQQTKDLGRKESRSGTVKSEKKTPSRTVAKKEPAKKSVSDPKSTSKSTAKKSAKK